MEFSQEEDVLSIAVLSHTNVQPVKDSVVLSLSKLWRQGGKYLKGAIAGNSNSFFNERRSFIYERLLVVFSNVI